MSAEVVSNNGSAEIVNMDDARARRRAGEMDPGDFENVGAYLKAVREASGLTLDALSSATHVKQAFFDAIERMDIDALPSRPFALGFVKAYAGALNLDAEAMVRRFKEDAGFSAPPQVEAEKFEAVHAAPTGGTEERPELSLLAVVAILAFILWCAYQITLPRPDNVTTPFSLAPEASAPSAPAPAQAIAGAIRGAPEPAFSDLVEARLTEGVEPVYPQRCELGAAPVETVEVAFNVTAAGRVSGPRVAASSNSCFNDAALIAVRRWRFEPRTVDGTPTPAYDLRYTFRFNRPM